MSDTLMPEEKVSYLEPIEDDASRERFIPELGRKNAPEKPSVPEFASEKRSEANSESETMYQKILASAPVATSNSDIDVSDDARKVSLKTDADSKVIQLVELAQTKGVVHAVKVARSLNDFYVLDQMHDDLSNRLYDSLKAKGLITE